MTAKREYEVGKNKPPVHSRFKKGCVGNPGGKTSEQKKIELRNAEAAMRIRERVLSAIEAKLVECDMDAAIALILDPSALKMLKDAEDRGLGAPVQPLTSPDGSMTPRPTVIEFVAPQVKADEGDD